MEGPRDVYFGEAGFKQSISEQSQVDGLPRACAELEASDAGMSGRSAALYLLEQGGDPTNPDELWGAIG